MEGIPVNGQLIRAAVVSCTVLLVLLLFMPVMATTSGKVVITADVVLPPPIADFTADITEGTAPLAVKFTDTSTGSTTSWAWEFGDGATSSEKNPVHVYTAKGKYTVTLTAANGAGSSTKTEHNFISVKKPKPQHKPHADFTATPRTGTAPLAVQFTDASANDPDSWSWHFGDHSEPSSDQNPSHTYTRPGRYTVTLHVSNERGDDIAIKPNYIEIPEPALKAAFTGTPLTGTAPLSVRFTDTSTGSPGLWIWRFGDDPFDFSFQQNPVHVYRHAGSYTVRLTVFRMGEADTEIKDRYITVAKK
jgi:PKD repeat protein